MKNKKWSLVPFIRMIRQSIRFQLVLTFITCLIIAVITGVMSQVLVKHIHGSQSVTYADGMDRIDEQARVIVHSLLKNPYDPDSQIGLQSDLNHMAERENVQVLLVDFQGNVLAKSYNANPSRVSLKSIVEEAMQRREQFDRPGPYVAVYPVSILNHNAFAVITGIPDANIKDKDWIQPIPIMVGIVSFMLLFFRLTRRKMAYIENLEKGLVQISKGDLSFRVRVVGEDELASLADHMNEMAINLGETIEEERRAEQTKNELITNVSHDLRTPLTLIMGYLTLLKDGKYQSDAQLKGYIEIAYGKSQKLKKLIDDLFEFTKISNEGFQLQKETVNLGGLLEQLVEELNSISDQNHVSVVKELPAQPVMVQVDPSQLTRVYENILNNAFKYSDKPGVIKVSLHVAGGRAIVCVENKADPIPSTDLENLFERFYRVDKSRSSNTGGSGLGLAIAKGIVERHGGEIWAECEDRIIKFFVTVATSR